MLLGKCVALLCLLATGLPGSRSLANNYLSSYLSSCVQQSWIAKANTVSHSSKSYRRRQGRFNEVNNKESVDFRKTELPNKVHLYFPIAVATLERISEANGTKSKTHR